MKKILLVSLAIMLFISCQQDDTAQIQEIIDSVKKEYRPDGRVGIFDIDIEKVDAVYVLKGKSSIPNATTILFEKLKEAKLITGNKVEKLPSENLNGKRFGIVNVSVCNMRSKGKHSAELGTQSLLGMTLNILFEENGWYRVQNMADNYLGWLDAGAFHHVTTPEIKKYLKKDKVIYTNAYGFVLDREDKMVHVSDITAGGIMILDGETSDYFNILMPDGRQGRVAKSEAMKFDDWSQKSAFTADNFVATAHRFIGTPYVWGGTSPKGMDCSGFTKTAAYLNGVILARDASQQVHQGEEVPTDKTLKNLQKGDLLFFGREATAEKKERITHVAIYLGDGKIIHDTGRVKIESLKSGDEDFNEDRLNTFVRARRVIGNNSLRKVVF